MTEDERRRSEAFVEAYYALCEEWGVRVEHRFEDVFVAVAVGGSASAGGIDLIDQAEWEELDSKARASERRIKLGREVRCVVCACWLWQDERPTAGKVAEHLSPGDYDRDTEHGLLEELVAELKREEPGLFNRPTRKL